MRQNFAVVLAGGGPRGATRPAPTLAPTEAEAATFDEGDLNRFGYLEGDADGARCPIGSHVLRGRETRPGAVEPAGSSRLATVQLEGVG